MHADVIQTVEKSPERVGSVGRGQNHDIRSAEIKGLVGGPRTRVRLGVKELINNFDHSAANSLNGSKFAHIYARQLLSECRFVAGKQRPMSKVIGESLPDEMMFLQRAQRVLKDRIFRADLDGVQ